jgi:RNA polymerase sigma-70 factor, ECF subfamily
VIVWRRQGHYAAVNGAGLPRTGPARDAFVDRELRVRTLVAEHFDFIWRLLRRRGLSPADADDAAQQVFMVAAQKLQAIAEGSERSFLYGTALRVAASTRRAQERRREAPSESVDTDARAAFDAGTEERVELARAWKRLDDLLAKLPEILARVLVLAEIEELEVKEIASLEGIPVGTAASRLRRAREQFRELLATSPGKNPFKREV